MSDSDKLRAFVAFIRFTPLPDLCSACCDAAQGAVNELCRALEMIADNNSH